MPSPTAAPVRVHPQRSWALHDVAATRRIETTALAAHAPHALMQRAGLAVARLAQALAPHARRIWVAAGPGNNGGDGIEAAMHLHRWGRDVALTWLGEATTASADTAASLRRAQEAGVAFLHAPPEDADYAIDALLGIGAARAPAGRMAGWIALMHARSLPVLAVDTPTGLDADTGRAAGPVVRAGATLSLLTLKPGLFTADGRDACGQVWLDDLGVSGLPDGEACAVLSAAPTPRQRPHGSHKGSWGDVVVAGGDNGMTGAVLLAALAALNGGAGRVYAAPLAADAPVFSALHPALMQRRPDDLAFADRTVVCGCGGGAAVQAMLPRVLSEARALVLDADGLNAVARDAALQRALSARADEGRASVLTPHPLEAARLLGADTAAVQGHRLQSARALAERFRCTVVLKGSGSIVASPQTLPAINPTGNARLATAGTGDVLAGMVGAALAQGLAPHDAACTAVFLHGRAADLWPPGQPFSAEQLAAGLPSLTQP